MLDIVTPKTPLPLPPSLDQPILTDQWHLRHIRYARYSYPKTPLPLPPSLDQPILTDQWHLRHIRYARYSYPKTPLPYPLHWTSQFSLTSGTSAISGMLDIVTQKHPSPYPLHWTSHLTYQWHLRHIRYARYSYPKTPLPLPPSLDQPSH